MRKKVKTYIGLMCGTSVDAMDAILVDFAADKSAAGASYEVLARASLPFAAGLRQRLLKFNTDDSCSLAELALLDRAVALLAAAAVNELLAASGKRAAEVQAIGFAGQTLAHHPPPGGPGGTAGPGWRMRGSAEQAPRGWTFQCGDPNILAEETGIAVVADIRRRDLAAGGQGAPLACSFHHSFLSSADEERGIINLGGISNITLLHPGRDPLGFDMGPANCLLDEWYATHHPVSKPANRDLASVRDGAAPGKPQPRGKPAASELGYDKDGRWAAGGAVINDLLMAMLGDDYFSLPSPKTTGRDYFNLAWLENYLQGLDAPYGPQDVQATLTDLAALSISLAVQSYCGSVEDADWRQGKGLTLYAAGGGARNKFLMRRIKHLVKFPLENISALGVAEKDLEPLAFAWLAYLRLHGKSGNLPSISGAAGPRTLGAVYT